MFSRTKPQTSLASWRMNTRDWATAGCTGLHQPVGHVSCRTLSFSKLLRGPDTWVQDPRALHQLSQHLLSTMLCEWPQTGQENRVLSTVPPQKESSATCCEAPW